MRFFRDLTLAAVACFAVLLALEGGLRVAGAHYEASLYQPEDERGYALRPGSEGWSTEEADVYVRINSDGMRDRERPVARPPHTLRIAVVGSSEADARQVPLDRTFEAVLGRDLSARLLPAGWQADVLNFGVPGYTFSQEYLTLRNHVWKYDPQVVVFVFSAFQVLKTTRNFFPGELKGAPVYVFQDGRLVPDSITRNTPALNAARLRWKNRLSDWMNRSRLLSLFNETRIGFHRVLAGLRPHSGSGGPSALSKATRWSYDPGDPEIQPAWAIAEEFVRIMKEDCERHHAEFRIVVANGQAQVHPSLAERAAAQRRMQVSSLDGVDRRMEDFGRANGIPVLTLSGPLGEYAAAHGVYLHMPLGGKPNAGHWNEEGHEQVGHAIARDLLENSAAVAAVSPRSREVTQGRGTRPL